MARLGKTGKESAIISRREDGYHIAHLEGDTPPRVNDVSIGDSSQLLRDGDRVHIGNLELPFYTDGGTPAAAEVEAMLAALRAASVKVEDLEIGRADLEDVFLEIMQKEAA